MASGEVITHYLLKDRAWCPQASGKPICIHKFSIEGALVLPLLEIGSYHT
jgi:hypothetical protein